MGRNRCLLSAYAARTSRNQPSNSKSVFGPSCWIRGLIKPPAGQAIAYCDWSGQEYGIAAYLSHDPTMIADYESGDPYLAFGKRVGIVPGDATKDTHPGIREQLKTTLGLGAMYGAGAKTVSLRIGKPEPFAQDLLRKHQESYPIFWAWSRSAVDHALLGIGFGPPSGGPCTLAMIRIPGACGISLMQGNGAELMRLASCLATERGISVGLPVHDTAVLVEGQADCMDEVVKETKAAMAEASRVVLGGFALRTDTKIVHWPDRYMDKRGIKMWNIVMKILKEVGGADTAENESADRTCPTGSPPPVPPVGHPFHLIKSLFEEIENGPWADHARNGFPNV